MMGWIDIKKWMGLPVLASEHGQDVDRFIVYVHWLMITLFIGWFCYFCYALYRFRRSRQPKADYTGVKSHASNYLEGAVALVETALLVGFAIPLWAKVVDDFPAPAESTEIRIVAEQFGWNARYPGPDGVFGAQDRKFVTTSNPLGYDPEDPQGKDDLTFLNDIRVPVGKPVLIHLTSKDVIHSMAIKPLRVCQDAIPGMRIPVHFKPTRVGNYQITCAQLCGNGHFSMRGSFRVVPPEDFAQWQAENAPAGPVLGFE